MQVIRIATSLLLASILGGNAWADTPVSISNGSFEGGFSSVNASSGTGISVTPTGWTLDTPGGESRASWSESGNTMASPDGGNWWSLEYVTGWTTSGTGAARFNAGGIQQTLTGLTVGYSYAVSFYSLANAPATSSENSLGEYWAVSFGSSTQNGATVYSNQHNTWVQSTLSFKATSTSQALNFVGTWLNAVPGSTPTYLNIDGITVTDTSTTPVPEPASISLGLVGLGFFGVTGWLKKRRAVRG